MESVAFHFSQIIHHAFGLLLVETMSPRTIKNRPIWSHWHQLRICCLFSTTFLLLFKALSHDVHLTHMSAADCGISAVIENFLIFNATIVCCRRMRQIHVIQMSLMVFHHLAIARQKIPMGLLSKNIICWDMR